MKTSNSLTLNKQEYMHLANKVNNNCLNVEYFRKSLFNTSFRGSRDLERKKTIYKDSKTTIKVDRSLNQKHRDLLSLLPYEKKSKVAEDGSYYIKTSLYSLAKKMRYKYPVKDTEKVKILLEDMQKTLIQVKQKSKIYTHTLLGHSFYDEDNFEYIIQIPAETAKYHIYSTGVSIPEKLNEKIVSIENSKSRLKALISFMLSNKKLENGMYFNTMCEKLDIIEKTAKSKFKKQIIENLELLKEFKIKFEDDKFFLKKEKCTFFPALSEKQIISFEKTEQDKRYDAKLADVMKHKKDENIVIYKYIYDGKEVKIKFRYEKLAYFVEDEFMQELTNDDVRKMILNLLKEPKN